MKMASEKPILALGIRRPTAVTYMAQRRAKQTLGEVSNMEEEDKVQPEQTEPQEEPKPEPKEGAAGVPDETKAAEKYKAQRDDARKLLADLQEKVASLEGQSKDVEALKKELEEARQASDEAAKKAEYVRVNTARLATAGCVDIDVALTLLDENGDVDKLKEEKPYLFGTNNKGATGFKPAGVPDDVEARRERARKAAGIKN